MCSDERDITSSLTFDRWRCPLPVRQEIENVIVVTVMVKILWSLPDSLISQIELDQTYKWISSSRSYGGTILRKLTPLHWEHYNMSTLPIWHNLWSLLTFAVDKIA